MTFRDCLIEYAHGRMTAEQVVTAFPDQFKLESVRINSRGAKQPLSAEGRRSIAVHMSVYGAFLLEFGCAPKVWTGKGGLN